MTLVAMFFLAALVSAGALVTGVGVVELRQGREAIHRVVLDGAAEAALVRTLPGGWLASTLGAPSRTAVAVPAVMVRPRLAVALEAEAIGADVWLLHASASMADQSGNRTAAVRAGWLVRVGVFPPDTVLSARVIRRPWLPGFE